MTSPHITNIANIINKVELSRVPVIPRPTQRSYFEILQNLPPTSEPLPQSIKQELYLITCALGFLSVYAQENNKPKGHEIYPLINNLTKIVKLYKSRYNHIIKDSFDLFDEITGDKNIEIDVICFANNLLVFHKKIQKHFKPKQALVSKFWLEYKKNNPKAGETYKNSRMLALEFFERL